MNDFKKLMVAQTRMLQCVYAIKSHLKLIKNIYILIDIEFVFNFKKAERFNDFVIRLRVYNTIKLKQIEKISTKIN